MIITTLIALSFFTPGTPFGPVDYTNDESRYCHIVYGVPCESYPDTPVERLPERFTEPTTVWPIPERVGGSIG